MQLEISSHPARFKVVSAGRRSGKTRLGAWLCIKTGVEGGRAWWVAPTYKVSNVGWRLIKMLAKQVPGTVIREGDRLVEFPSGGSVQVRSADDPDSLRGESLDLVVIDEAAYVQERAWTEALRPALSDRKGSAVFISTPAGKNYFWRLWLMGQDPGRADWMSWKFPTLANPFIDPKEIETAKLDLVSSIFQQEYSADFIDDGGLVFRNVRRCVYGPGRAPHPSSEYVAGVDWAQMHDYTVIAIIEKHTRQLVYMDAFNQISWALQYDRLQAAIERYHVSQALVELNSIGSPGLEALQQRGLPVTGFTTTNETKTQIVQDLALAFEQGDIGIIDDPALLAELESFTAERLPSGRWRYSAPDGMFDDRVMALCLAWNLVRQLQNTVMVTAKVKWR